VLTWYLHTAEAAATIISANHARVPLGPQPAGVHPLAFSSLDEALTWCEAERPGLRAATRLAASAGLHEIGWKLPAAAMSFYYRRSHWGDWVATHEAGLASARALDDRQAEAWMLNNLGMAYGDQRRQECAGYFEQALAIYRAMGDHRGETRAANNVASAWFNLGRFDEALAAGLRSLEIQRRNGNRYGEGIALGVLGGSCQRLGRFAEATDHLQAALAIFRELGDRMAEADSLSDLGEAYLGLGRVGEAVDALTLSLAIWQDIGDRHGLAATLLRLGHAQQAAGDAEHAYELLSQAAALFDELGDRAQAADARSAQVANVRRSS